MKKLLLILILALVSINFATAVGTVIDDKVNLDVIRINPSTVSPGEEFDIYLQIEPRIIDNLDNDLTDTYLKFLDTYPFYLVDENERVKFLGKIPEGSYKQVSFKARVDPHAIDGDQDLKFMFISDGFGAEIVGPIKITVQSRNIVLDIAQLETIPEQIGPGDTGQIRITVRNTATSLMRDVSVKLDLELALLQESLASTAASISDEIPIAPINSGSEKKVATIPAGESATFTYDIMVYPDAKAKVYKVPLIIEYYDNAGNNYSKRDIVGIVIGGMPDLSINIDSTDIYSSGGLGNIIIKFVNKGPIDIKFLNVKLEESDDFEVLSSDEVYIGNIDSDDYETAEFRVNLKTRKKTVNLPLLVEYKDGTNQDYNKKVDIDFTIRSAKEMGVAKSNAGSITFLIIIIIIILFIHNRSWKKKHADKSLGDYFKYLFSKFKRKRKK